MAASDVGCTERAVARLATRQGGAVSRSQLLELGLSPQEIKTRVRNGGLIGLYRGVYAVGHLALTDHGRVTAALLAAGPQAVASHRTAAAIWALLPSMPAVLDVTLLQGDRRPRHGLRIHHTSDPPDIRIHRGLRVTTPLRTLADLGHPDDLTREALARRLLRPEDLPRAAPAPTRSVLERRMLALVRGAGLAEPLVNHRIGCYTVDFAWPELRLVVETDGWGTHGDRRGFEDDRARDAHLAAMGQAVLRFTWLQITGKPLLVVSRLAQAAAGRAASASNSSALSLPVASATGS